MKTEKSFEPDIVLITLVPKVPSSWASSDQIVVLRALYKFLELLLQI